MKSIHIHNIHIAYNFINKRNKNCIITLEQNFFVSRNFQLQIKNKNQILRLINTKSIIYYNKSINTFSPDIDNHILFKKCFTLNIVF